MMHDDKCVIFAGIIPVMWIELVISVLMIGLGICLIVGINYVRKNFFACLWSDRYFRLFFDIH